jgi:transcriptional regulator with XRE-family HTH domain
MKILGFFGGTMATLRDLVGSRIRLLRKAAGKTQADLAELIDVDPQLIGRYERGLTMPSVENLISLSKALKVSPAELLPGGDDEIREQLITFRRIISEMAMRIDSPKHLEEVIALMQKFAHDID